MKYEPVASSRTWRTRDHRSRNSTSNSPIRSIRIEIDEVVLEGFNDKQIDNEKLATNIMANLSQLVQNNVESISNLAVETKVNNKNKTDYRVRFPIGNPFGDKRSIYVSTIDTKPFQISNSVGGISTNIGQNLSTSIFRSLLGLSIDKYG